MFTLLNMAMCFVAPTGAKTYFGIHSGTKMNQVRAIKFLGNYFKNRLPHKNGYMAQNPSHPARLFSYTAIYSSWQRDINYEDMTSRMLATVPHASWKIPRMTSMQRQKKSDTAWERLWKEKVPKLLESVASTDFEPNQGLVISK